MDWDLAIKRNSEALNRIVAALFAMLGLDGVAPVGRIPQPLHRAVLRVLWPAESAVRRLIVIAARGLVVKLAPSRPKPKGPIGKGGGGSKPPSFQLFDQRKNFARPSWRKARRVPPRIHFFTGDSWVSTTWSARPPFRCPMAWSMASVSAAGFRASRQHSRICRARPGVLPAGGSGGRTRQV